MLESATISAAGWYRDPRDRRGVRFHDGKAWTRETHPGAGKLMGQRPANRPRAAMSRGELQHRQLTASRWAWLGQELDVYL